MDMGDLPISEGMELLLLLVAVRLYWFSDG